MRIESPASALEAAELIAGANADGRRVEIRGGGSKRGWGGGAGEGDLVLSTARLASVIDYDAAEMVLTVGAGTKLAEINRLLAANSQGLGFEPPDLGHLFGGPSDQATIGGVLAANLSGPRRISSGAARDHFLGFEGVTGRGLAFKAGGRVVKNVTGFDLPKLMAGSWGTLALLTAVTLKVVPRPKTSATLLIHGLSPSAAVQAMTRAMSVPLAVSGAAHQPGVTALRLEGFGPSVEARMERLKSDLPGFELEDLDELESQAFWRRIAHLDLLAGEGEIWRSSVPPSAGGILAGSLTGPWLIDWAGGLVWSREPLPGAVLVRGAARAPALADPLSSRVGAAFDPNGVFLPRPAVIA